MFNKGRKIDMLNVGDKKHMIIRDRMISMFNK